MTGNVANFARLDKVLTRILTDDDTGVLVARNVLLKSLRSAGIDPLDVTLAYGDDHDPARSWLQSYNEELREQNSILLERIAELEKKLRDANRKKAKAEPPKPQEPEQPPPPPPKPPMQRRRGRRRHLVLRDGVYAFRYRWPGGGSVERKLYTDDGEQAEAMAAELLAKIKAGQAI